MFTMERFLRNLPVAFLLAILSLPSAMAAIEERVFDTPEQQERYERLIADLRCPLCLNSNLAGSDAPIAADLRQQIYEQIMAGRSDREIIEFMTARYGDFILYRPPLTPGTYLLWFGPPLLLIAGFFIVRRTLRSSQENRNDDELNADERRRLQHYLSSNPER